MFWPTSHTYQPIFRYIICARYITEPHRQRILIKHILHVPGKRRSITTAADAHCHHVLISFATTCHCVPPHTYLHNNHWNVLGGRIVGNFGTAACHLWATIAAMDAASRTVWRYMAAVKQEVTNLCLFPLLFCHTIHLFSLSAVSFIAL